MPAISPFIEKTFSCPVCDARGKHRLLRERIFVAEDRESDQHITQYRWLREVTQQAHPPYFFLLYCPECLYADTAEDFAAPNKNTFLPLLTRALRNAGEKERLVIQLLGAQVKGRRADFETNLALHLLAVYQHSLPKKDFQDAYKIGRLLLRTAWLYREQGASGAQELHVALREDAARPERAIATLLEQVDVLKTALDQLAEKWDAFGAHLKVCQDEKENTGGGSVEDVFAERQKNIEPLLSSMGDEISRLRIACKQELAAAVKPELAKAERPARSESDLQAFFEKVQALWPSVPTDEGEAMRMAIPFFQRTLSSDPRIDSAQAQFSLVSLITDLLIRCDDLDKAFVMVREMYKSAATARQSCLEKLRDPNLDAAARRRFEARGNRAGESLEQASELRYQLIDLLIERNRPTIDKVLAEHRGAAREVLEKALLERGVPPGILPRLLEEGGSLSKGKKR